MNNYETYSRNDRRFWLGALFVIVGGAWLLDNLNIIPYYVDEYIFRWYTLLILIGLYFIIGRKKPEPGIIMIAVGSLFLLDDLNVFDIRNVWHVFWPLVVIMIGVSLMMRRSFGGFKKNTTHNPHESIDYIDDFAILGGRERSIDSKNFKGGKITTLFGGSEIDLRNADLAEGIQELDVFVMFGGTEIMVPPGWAIQIEVVSLLGTFSDKRINALKVVPEPGKTLIIKGFVMFGGGEIKLNK